jgi:hypothetical protein
VAKYEFIDSYAVTPKAPAVVRMCRWLEVNSSGFYHWPSRPVSATAARRQALAARVRHFFGESEVGRTGAGRTTPMDGQVDRMTPGVSCNMSHVHGAERPVAILPASPRPAMNKTHSRNTGLLKRAYWRDGLPSGRFADSLSASVRGSASWWQVVSAKAAGDGRPVP